MKSFWVSVWDMQHRSITWKQNLRDFEEFQMACVLCVCVRSSNIIHECQILSFCLDKRELETLAKFESLLAQRRWYNIQSWYTYFVSHSFRMSYRINSRQWAYFFFFEIQFDSPSTPRWLRRWLQWKAVAQLCAISNHICWMITFSFDGFLFR